MAIYTEIVGRTLWSVDDSWRWKCCFERRRISSRIEWSPRRNLNFYSVSFILFLEFQEILSVSFSFSSGPTITFTAKGKNCWREIILPQFSFYLEKEILRKSLLLANCVEEKSPHTILFSSTWLQSCLFFSCVAWLPLQASQQPATTATPRSRKRQLGKKVKKFLVALSPPEAKEEETGCFSVENSGCREGRLGRRGRQATVTGP